MDLFKQTQQEMYKREKRRLEEFSASDVLEKQRRVNEWITNNKGYNLDNLRANLQKMYFDDIALANAFLEVYVILNYLFHLKTSSSLIKKYKKVIDRFDILQKLRDLVVESQGGIGTFTIRDEISDLIKNKRRDMLFIVHFVVDNTKITQKKSPYEEFEGSET